ncbi:DUF2141 domain-containing protein [Sphingomonas sp. SRS2]|uniref:DUF2141 domain-containing protein n=1 Tax=Sphingomonas sp. SRS2 TaxID=133190 RepID=UPI0006184CCC|nr:DUF2141 domain-containing protein [Sphingomonas sp. SRS2]KKC26739.1 hypothetical protein WP12_07325 [Sphingomonas sp. SRS2]
MSKLVVGLAGLMLVAAMPADARAAVLGPDAAACTGVGPAMLVHIEGLKKRNGMLRVQSYGGNPNRYFEKGAYLRRVDVAVPASGPVDICVPVPAEGTYAVSVRHDVDASGKTGMNDGGGMSGNPKLSLFDVIFKRKPSPERVKVSVRGVARIPVTMNYVQGSSFGPIAMAAR